MKRFITFLFVVVAAVLVGFQLQTRNTIPPHMLGLPASFHEDLLTEKQRADLFDLVKEMKEFPTNTADTQFYEPKHEHIGEGKSRNFIALAQKKI